VSATQPAVVAASLQGPAPPMAVAFVVALLVVFGTLLTLRILWTVLTPEPFVEYGQSREDEDPWLPEYGPRPQNFPAPTKRREADEEG
jgi:hypothetical protein